MSTHGCLVVHTDFEAIYGSIEDKISLILSWQKDLRMLFRTPDLVLEDATSHTTYLCLHLRNWSLASVQECKQGHVQFLGKDTYAIVPLILENKVEDRKDINTDPRAVYVSAEEFMGPEFDVRL